jgi:SAM-dependent methyltransferase
VTDILMRPVTACQICGSADLRLVLSMGFIPPVNEVRKSSTPGSDQVAYPLDLLRCGACHLVQLGVELPAEVLFPADYPYRSGTTRILRENFAALAVETEALLGDGSKPLIIDIGSNDGTLLNAFAERGFPVHGIEPTDAAKDANARGIETTQAYFSMETVNDVRTRVGAPGVVTAANVFAHIADVDQVMAAIGELLATGGVFISESHYLGALVETVQVDTVYHEHLRYYALDSLNALFARHGMEVFRVQRIPTHGGSIRVYAAAKGQIPVDSSVPELLEWEAQLGLTDGSVFDRLSKRATAVRRALPTVLAGLVGQGKRVFGIGAPSRASTLINYAGLDVDLVETVLEVPNSPKIGGLIPGTRIPIEDERRLYTDQPDYALMLSWHIADELMPKLKANGFKGDFIVPLPETIVVPGADV